MSPENALTLCIPTYQRADVLLDTTSHHIKLAGKYQLPFIIANNCSTDHTDATVDTLKAMYPNIEYYKHDTNIRDHNFPFVLRQSKTEYAWLLGDKHKICAGGIERFLEMVEHETYDLIVTNHDMRVQNLPTAIYTDPEKLLVDLGWHMTDITSLIFSKQFIERIPFERFSETNFMHVGGIFETLSLRPFRVLWLNESLFERFLSTTKSGWLNELFEVWLNSWPSVILSLPPSHYSLESKIKCLKKHNDNTIFTRKKIKQYRRQGIYDYKTYQKYKLLIPLCSSVPKSYFFFMSIIPAIILRLPLLFRNASRYLRGKEDCWKE